jgi:hypothetical protein
MKLAGYPYAVGAVGRATKRAPLMTVNMKFTLLVLVNEDVVDAAREKAGGVGLA